MHALLSCLIRKGAPRQDNGLGGEGHNTMQTPASCPAARVLRAQMDPRVGSFLYRSRCPPYSSASIPTWR